MALAREILAGLERCLHAHAGFDLPEWVVETRALARMNALELGERDYLELVSAPRGASELRALVEAVRVGETRFFRHRPQVDALLEVVVPAWRARGEKSPRIWSAGCATGEEPYTLALVLARALPRPATPAILATDVSAEALATARRGVYPAGAADDVPEPWRDGLEVDGDVARVRPHVAALVRFKHQNLADAELPRGFDLVWCRNVLIYFGPEARKRVLAKLVDALEPGGFLFLGYSETLRDVAGLRAVEWGDQVLWQKSEGDLAAERAPAGQPARTASRAGTATHSHAQTAPKSARARAPAAAKAPAATRAAHTAHAAHATKTRVRIRATDPATLAAEIRAALGEPGLRALTIDLDAADFLDDAIAPVLRRAGAATEHAGIQLLLHASRPGHHRWLRRHGLARDE